MLSNLGRYLLRIVIAATFWATAKYDFQDTVIDINRCNPTCFDNPSNTKTWFVRNLLLHSFHSRKHLTKELLTMASHLRTIIIISGQNFGSPSRMFPFFSWSPQIPVAFRIRNFFSGKYCLQCLRWMYRL